MKKYNAKEYGNIRIDWDKPQWLISIKNKFIVLTTGCHRTDEFEATALPSDVYPDGSVSDRWSKDSFDLLRGTVMFPISNED